MRNIAFRQFRALNMDGVGDSHAKEAGMSLLGVYIPGVNYGFWYHLGCSGQNANNFSHQCIVRFRVAREEM